VQSVRGYEHINCADRSASMLQVCANRTIDSGCRRRPVHYRYPGQKSDESGLSTQPQLRLHDTRPEFRDDDARHCNL
jgi:hypothetical protein